MDTVKQLLQDADPLRYEAAPSLDALLVGVRLPAAQPPAVGAPSQAHRAPVVLALAAAVVAFIAAWLVAPEWPALVAPVAAQVRFEVRLAEESPVAGLAVAQEASTGRLVYMHPELVLGNDDIAHTWVFDDGTSRFGVGVQFFPDGANRIRQATAAHVGRPVAILLDGIVVMAPTVRSAIDHSAVITGDFTRDEASRIAIGLARR